MFFLIYFLNLVNNFLETDKISRIIIIVIIIIIIDYYKVLLNLESSFQKCH